MPAFEAASKSVVEEIDKKKLHHVPSEAQAKSLNLLSVVEDGIIKEWKKEDLQFEPEKYEETLTGRRINFTETVDVKLRAELNGVFGIDLSIGSKVTYKADFKKFAWRKLKNVDSLKRHLESRKFSRLDGKKGGLKDKLREYFWSNSSSFKVVTSVLYTTSPTEITLIHQSESGGSIKVNVPAGQAIKAGLKYSSVKKPVIKLPSDTPIAYGCVDVSVDKKGKMKVRIKDVFDGEVTPEVSSSTSATRKIRGQKRKATEPGEEMLNLTEETKEKKGKSSELGACDQWTKDEQQELHGLLTYYQNMTTICEKLYSSGTIAGRIPLQPNVNIKNYLKANLRNKTGGVLSLEQLSEYLSLKTFREAECGCIPIDTTTETNVDKLIHTVREGISRKCELSKCYLSLGCCLETLFLIYQQEKKYGSWKSMLGEKCNGLSTVYAQKLRAMWRLLRLYPRFDQLSVSFFEMDKRKSKITKMLQVPEHHDFWSKEN